MEDRPENESVEPTGGPPANRPLGRGRRAVGAVVAGLLLLSGGIGIGWGLSRHGANSPFTESRAPLSPAPQASPSGTSGGQLDLDAIEARVGPGVVDISTVLYGFPGEAPRGRTEGTGMVLTSSGQVLTNNHVIAGATSISVTIQGRGTHPATVVGAAPSEDVALLQVQGVSGVRTVALADSSELTTGQRVAAIGNAFGRGGAPTITAGSITALNRAITVGGREGAERLTGLIQTDAPVSPGESGGPLVNKAGQVVGIITAGGRSRSFGASRVSFAIPSNAAIGVVNEIRAGRESSRIIVGPAGFLGVEVQDLDRDTASRLGLNVTSGAFVLAVVPDAPADRAGLRRGAVITEIDGARITSADALGPAIRTHEPGERIAVTWVDRGGSHTASVTLIAGPAV